ncbi:uncharacterized protein LOC128735979 [Sabethes cyaneus]|uniref:uncharacterized protein LOC128735979 n=1 Tax=Sabethes cyaneus TaxID=53552 RepID=UPI00237D3830|nr:uncharacterized protein LOC128735979 [Sabethes cyaneus]
MKSALEEHNALVKRAEVAESALAETLENVAAEARVKVKETQNRSEKRKKDSPVESELPKKRKSDQSDSDEEGADWSIATNKKERKKKEKEKETKRNEEKTEVRKQEKGKPNSRRVRTKGDALIVEAKGETSYAALFQRMREDPKLKGLEKNVIKSRRTQNGELLFELKKDPASSAFKEMVEKVLGDEANVRALSQETTIECRELSMFTTENDLRQKLETENILGKVPMKIRLRKARSEQVVEVKENKRLLGSGSLQDYSACSQPIGEVL